MKSELTVGNRRIAQIVLCGSVVKTKNNLKKQPIHSSNRQNFCLDNCFLQTSLHYEELVGLLSKRRVTQALYYTLLAQRRLKKLVRRKEWSQKGERKMSGLFDNSFIHSRQRFIYIEPLQGGLVPDYSKGLPTPALPNKLNMDLSCSRNV